MIEYFFSLTDIVMSAWAEVRILADRWNEEYGAAGKMV